MLDGLDSAVIRQSHEDLLNQIFDLIVAANSLLEKTHQWSAEPPRESLKDPIAAGRACWQGASLRFR